MTDMDTAGYLSRSEGEALLQAHIVHASLYRPILFLGVEPAAAVIEVATAFLLVWVVQTKASIALAILYAIVVHGFAQRVAKVEPTMSQLYRRSLQARDYYEPHASLTAATPPVFPAVPEDTW